MNNTIKISLTIELEGSTLIRQSEPEIISFQIRKKDINPLKYKDRKNGLAVVRGGKVKHHPLVQKPASQHINLNRDAYDYFISDEVPSWMMWKKREWKVMKPTERLETHLRRICEHLGGRSFTYQVLND